ncbi:MAG: ACT domain-containing protein [Clostridia bacterium]|nr:ACT domain-containing protein [Clostridia bacterium]
MKKAIITVVGKDTVGIIAAICTYLSEEGINILDISQTIVDGWFNMMMVADVTGKDIAALSDALREVGEQKGVIVHCQSDEIFKQMHRI